MKSSRGYFCALLIFVSCSSIKDPVVNAVGGSCSGSDVTACIEAAHLASIAKDFHAQITYLKKACDYLDPFSCYNVNTVYVNEFQNEQRGLSYLKKACDLQYGNACFHYPIQAKLNGEEALPYFELSCAHNSPTGCAKAAALSPQENTKNNYLKKACELSPQEYCH